MTAATASFAAALELGFTFTNNRQIMSDKLKNRKRLLSSVSFDREAPATAHEKPCVCFYTTVDGVKVRVTIWGSEHWAKVNPGLIHDLTNPEQVLEASQEAVRTLAPKYQGDVHADESDIYISKIAGNGRD